MMRNSNHAPWVNLLAVNTTAAMAVSTAPVPFRAARGPQPGLRWVYQWCTRPA